MIPSRCGARIGARVGKIPVPRRSLLQNSASQDDASNGSELELNALVFVLGEGYCSEPIVNARD
jgi:hypothetical protein